ncbi:MAG: cation:proton antiporter [Alphaproteobacteria bacterium]|uniref:cation:proton antiporter domain-containing protein n=1 Tax=Brevundimonas sp. TaxID=1871086 RepID=UPI0017B820DB|nr:cation:proton antiporter [Brevundimonas sp.]MBU3971344.1 cation:proton antiporter [Alphaproteobacteria bacterium]MBA3048348.1 potassium transporter TrkA [Brevundimonas sp.]MBU3974712.1 cation:proton antiporter [Alphaproteobacteria bacterium]MBU4039226.1 cation:proton antiporter [Alphaproteobacteria bacterium]MBU4135199.1 cation:proton antiporter [Alphaproteobacteria bacterium]
MATHGGGGEYKDLVVFLAAAGVVVPLFNRLRISPVLGFLAAGVLLGPDGLARLADSAPWLSWLTISDAAQIRSLSELGVAFLLFMIGLELSWERLRAMRKLVFGLGLTQVAVCTVALAAVFVLMGQPLVSAAVLGMGLALSSTAVVMPVMAERGRIKTTAGRATFSILLAQDLAVAPILITVTVLAALAQSGVGSGDFDPAVLRPALFTLIPAAIGLALLVVLGRIVLRPMFRSVARAKARGQGQGQEMFIAASLLVVIGAGLAAQAAGLSMSLGALIAGLLLAETEFRREVEISIEPFKGLLLGVFFVGVGIGLDLDAVAADPAAVFGLAAMLTLLKAALIFGAARLWGLNNRTAVETALVLGPAGEFAFVILGAGLVEGIAAPAFTQTVLMAATISIFTVPLMALIADRLLLRAVAAPPELSPEALEPPTATSGQVLIVGFGRVGRLVGEMLTEHGQAFLAIDANHTTVAKGRAEGANVFYGDAGRIEMLQRCGIDTARAMVVTMDAPAKVDEVVAATRSLRPDLILIARARDSKHAARLYALGVTDAVPETTEASLQLAENTLVDLGVPMGLVLASIHERRDRFRKLFQEAMPEGEAARSPRALRSTLRR